MTCVTLAAIGLLLVSPARTVGADVPPAVSLQGDRDRNYHFAPVYRRFDRMAVRIDDLEVPEADDAPQLQVTIERWPIDEEEARWVVMRRQLQARPNGSAQTEVTLGTRHQQPPVGRYRLIVWLADDDGYQPIAAKRFYVIFNAYHAADDVYHPDAPRWLRSKLDIVRLEHEEKVVDRWALDIHHERVFKSAVERVDGMRSARPAGERLVRGVRSQIDGHWPQLADIHGEVPEASPPWDDELAESEIMSAAERLRVDERRGQCYDYAMLYVAMLRSVGVPAGVVTITDPAPMPHPDAPRRQVVWNYHVWAELYDGGRWWASDLAYLEDATLEQLPTGEDPGLQDRGDRWFARAFDDRARLWRAQDGEIREISSRYRQPVKHADGAPVRRFVDDQP